MELSNLQPGVRYAFHTKDFEPPSGAVIPGTRKERSFVGMKEIGAVGMPKEPFVEVERDNGTRHLIAVENIQAVEPV